MKKLYFIYTILFIAASSNLIYAATSHTYNSFNTSQITGGAAALDYNLGAPGTSSDSYLFFTVTADFVPGVPDANSEWSNQIELQITNGSTTYFPLTTPSTGAVGTTAAVSITWSGVLGAAFAGNQNLHALFYDPNSPYHSSLNNVVVTVYPAPQPSVSFASFGTGTITGGSSAFSKSLDISSTTNRDYIFYEVTADFNPGTPSSNSEYSALINMSMTNGSSTTYVAESTPNMGGSQDANATTVHWFGMFQRPFVGGGGNNLKILFRDPNSPYTSSLSNVQVTIFPAPAPKQTISIGSSGTINGGATTSHTITTSGLPDTQFLFYTLSANFVPGTPSASSAFSVETYLNLTNGSSLQYTSAGPAMQGASQDANATTLYWNGLLGQPYTGGGGLAYATSDLAAGFPTNSSLSNISLNLYPAVDASTYTISGNAGIAGATLSYTDGTAKTATADGSGNYSFTVSYNWSGTVTPSLTGYTFSPTNKTYTSVTSNQTSQNYTASAVTYTISGNAGVAGATLSWTDGTAKTTTADGSGNYSFAVSYNWSGTVTPSLTGYTFSPTSKTYGNVQSNQTSQNYTAAAITYTISGNTGVGGATLSWTDGTAKTATADGSGNYSFTVSYYWSGSVTPSLTGYTFSPASKTYTNVLANQTNQNYTALVPISGNTTVPGAVLTWTDGTVKTTTADGSGNYAITVPYDWSGTVTPSLTGYTFSPANTAYTNVTIHKVTSYNAMVLISGNAEVAGATLSWTDGTAKTATADGSGNYSLYVNYNWIGRVTPSASGYSFSPSYTDYSNVVAPQTNQTYTAAGITYTISGNAGVAGATLSWHDGTDKTATAAVDGSYSFTVSYGFTGTVTPSKTGYTFSPVNTSYSGGVFANQTNQNYTATAITYTISGNAGVGGATLSWHDGTDKTATALGDGSYSFIVSYGFTGTVTPSKTGYTFSPVNTSYSGGVFANQTNQNYTATAITYTISGNAGVGGATLSWHDVTDKTATALGDGSYSFIVSYGFTGTVTPSKTGYTFSPVNTSYSGGVFANQTNQNYTATAITYTISGNAGVAGATLSWTDGTAKTATADGSGNYSFTVSYNWSGTVTPSLTGYTFNPVSKTYTNILANQSTQNHIATAITYTIVGNATVPGATISWTDGTAKTATADGAGNYSITVSYNFSGTVTPSKAGYSFSPVSRTYTNVLANQIAQGYNAFVTISGNAGVPGATLSWNDGTAKTTTADGSGNYSLTVSYNFVGAITPSLTGYLFTPANKSYINLATSQTNQNYTALVTISGNAGIAGATLSWTDGTAKTATADGSGNYSITVSYNFTGTVTPSLTDYAFTPSSRSYTNVPANQTSQNYTATSTAPVLSSIEGAALNYNENDPAKNISDSIKITDPYNTNLQSAVVQITGNYVSSQDVLTFTNQNGISGGWNSTTGTMTLTGAATVANYQAALRAVKYSDAISNPNTSARTISFTVNDGSVNSNTETRQINLNLRPTVTINQASGQSDPTNSSPINFTVAFSKTVTGFATGKVTLGGTAPGTLIGTVTGSGTTYNVAVTGMTGAGTVIATIAAGVASDANSATNKASTSTDNTVSYDPTLPNGSGTSADPYLIATLDNLKWVTQNSSSWSKYFKQTADIDASTTSTWDSGNGFSPIGNSTTQFTGTYDGNDHTITGLTVTRSTTDGIGMFGYTSQPAVIKNLGQLNVNITGHNFVGGLVGYAYSPTSISNSYSTGSVSGNYVGGLVGYTSTGTSISNSYSTGLVSGNFVGGFVGVSFGSISNSYSTGSVSGSSYVGGLVGSVGGGSISNSFWDTQTSGQSSSAGGTGKTTAEMKTPSTFLNAGWDFKVETANGTNNYWDVDNVNESINNGYPFLSWQNGATVTVSTAAPTISFGNPSATLTKSGPVTYSLTYKGEASVNLTMAKITLNKTGTADGTVSVSNGATLNPTVTISSITGDGTLGISIQSGTSSSINSIADAGAGPSAGFRVDNTPPTVSIAAPRSSLTKSGPVTYAITYSGASSINLASGNITLNKTGTANGTVSVSNGTTATPTVTVSSITGDGTLGISIAAGTASDSVGNTAAAAGPSTTFTVDNTAPHGYTVSIDQSAINLSNKGAVSFTFLNGELNSTYNYTFSSSGGGTNVTGSGTITGSNQKITNINLGGLNDGTITLSVTLTDSAGNTGSAATITKTKDVVQPSVSISSNQTSAKNNVPFIVTIEFGEAVTGFNGGDITIANGIISNFTTVSQREYTVNITPSSVGVVTIDIASSVAQDSAGNGNLASSQFNMPSEDNPPVLANIEGTPLSYMENESATQVTNSITVSDVDNVNMASATVNITGNYQSDEDVLSFTNQNGITGSWNATTGTMTLSGSATNANYQSALRNVKYFNTSSNPNTSPRTVSFTINDGSDNSNTLTRQITVTAINNPPVLAAIEGTILSYTEKDSATRITDSITVSDPDNANMASATVQITVNYHSNQDVLSFTNQNGITGSWNASTGIMTLTGSSSDSSYQTALRSVKYFNTSDNPDTSLRTISFTINDGDTTSVAAVRKIRVIAVDDPPVINFVFRPITFNENETITIPFSQLYPFITDPDNADSTLKLTFFSSSDNNLTITGKTDSSVTIKPKENWFGVDTVKVTVSDGTLSTSASFAVSVIFVNQLPVFSSVPDSVKITGSDSAKVNIFNLVSDVETPDSLLKFVFKPANDSLVFSYDSTKGVLSLFAKKGYGGITELTITVTDQDGGVVDTTLTIRIAKNLTGVERLAGQVPRDYELYQNYPNPFNPSTTIRYALPEESNVVIKAYNILGQEVSTLFDGRERAGYYEEVFDASRLASGVYFYTVVAKSVASDKKYEQVKKMMLMK